MISKYALGSPRLITSPTMLTDLKGEFALCRVAAVLFSRLECGSAAGVKWDELHDCEGRHVAGGSRGQLPPNCLLAPIKFI